MLDIRELNPYIILGETHIGIAEWRAGAVKPAKSQESRTLRKAGLRRCICCKQVKSLNEEHFPKNSKPRMFGFGYICLGCQLTKEEKKPPTHRRCVLCLTDKPLDEKHFRRRATAQTAWNVQFTYECLACKPGKKARGKAKPKSHYTPLLSYDSFSACG